MNTITCFLDLIFYFPYGFKSIYIYKPRKKVSPNQEKKPRKTTMGDDVKHFVLAHGVCHGSWCWYRLIALLKQAGHRVTALDLGACGINPKQLNEITSIWDYVDPLMEFMASLPQGESVILVGHSYAGLCISLAMESFPEKVSLGVFVTAYMPDFKSPPLTLIQEVKSFFPNS